MDLFSGRDNDDVLRKVVDFEVVGRRGRKRPKIRRQVKEQIKLKKMPSTERSGAMLSINFQGARSESGHFC